jgi:hypothetical protein
MKIKVSYIIPFLVLLLTTGPLLAQVMSSGDYIMERDNFNINGGLNIGGDYNLEGTVGQPVSGLASNASEGINQGYQQSDGAIGPICGNSVCEPGENYINCPADCPSPPPPPPPPPTPLAISGVQVSAITINSASFSWLTNNGAVCQLFWGTDNTYASGTLSNSSYIFSHNASITGLLPNTDYYFKLSCIDQYNSTAVSENNPFTTLAIEEVEVPNVINLRTETGDSTISLFWTNPTADNFSGVIINRATDFFPNIEEGTRIYSGWGIVNGTEHSFVDSGLTNGITYYYSVFSYDELGNFSTGVSINATPTLTVIEEEEEEEEEDEEEEEEEDDDDIDEDGEGDDEDLPFELPPPSEIIITDELYFSDFNFFQNNNLFNSDNNNVVSLNTENSTLIILPSQKVPSQVKKIIINLSANGEVFTYIFSLSDNGDFRSLVAPIIDPGSYFATIVLLDENDRTVKVLNGRLNFSELKEKEPLIPGLLTQVTEPIDSLREGLVEAFEVVAEIIDSPAGRIGLGVTAALSAINLIVAAPWWNLWYLLQFLFTQPFALFLKRKSWGTVYNSLTKMPVDLALVRLYDVNTKKLVASRVTDKDGRYVFLVNEGEYYLEASKNEYKFPSKLLNKIEDDGSYFDLYYGETIKIDEKSAIVANIPLDREDIKITNERAIKEFKRKKFFSFLSLVGPTIAFFYMLVVPNWYSVILMTVHLIIFIYFRRSVEKKSLPKWGKIFDCESKKPLGKAVARIFSSEYGRMLEYYVTDNYGRYGFLVRNNKYYVTGDKDGYQTAKTSIIDLTKEKESEILARDLGLVKDTSDKQGTACEVEVKPPETATEIISKEEDSNIKMINDENKENVTQETSSTEPKTETITENKGDEEVIKENIFG